MKIPFYLLLLTGMLAASASEEGAWTEELTGGWDVRYISNGRIVLGLAPHMGGRIVDLRLAGDDFNWVRLEEDRYLKLRREDVSPYFYGLNYGGIRDVHAPSWPGLDFNDKSYTTEVKPGRSIVSWAAAQGVRSHRVMELIPDTTTFRIDVTLTNTRDQYLDIMCRLGAEYRSGDGKNYTIFPDAEGTLVKVEYILGREEGRGMRPAHGGWVAKVDQASEAAMLIRYPAEEVERFLLWTGAGAAESMPEFAGVVPEGYYGFTGVQLWQTPEETRPGGERTFWQEHSLYEGLTMIDLVHERTVMQIELDRPVYAPGEPVTVRVAAARPERLSPFEARVDALDESVAMTFRCPEAGRAEWQEWTLPAAPAEDGEYPITLTALGQTAQQTLNVAGEELTALERRMKKAGAELEEFRDRGGLARETYADMGAAFLEDAAGHLSERNLEAVRNLLDQLEQNIRIWRES